MRKLGEELERLHTGEKIPEDILFKLRMLLSVMDGMKEDCE